MGNPTSNLDYNKSAGLRRRKDMALKKKTQDTIVKGMKQNKVKPLNAGQKREQLTAAIQSFLAGPREVKIELIKMLVDSL